MYFSKQPQLRGSPLPYSISLRLVGGMVKTVWITHEDDNFRKGLFASPSQSHKLERTLQGIP